MPKLTAVTINYNSSIKANLARRGKQHAYESMQISDSESRTYDVSDMADADVDAFIAGERQAMKERIDDYVMDGYNEIFE